MQNQKRIWRRILCTGMLSVLLLAGGCAGQQVRTNSSVVDYLYPSDGAGGARRSNTVPSLTLPLRVGVAFVPEQSSVHRGRSLWGGDFGFGVLTAAYKAQLLERVAEHFRQYAFVRDIEVIPSEYLTPGGSFTNLDQIQAIYDLDVVALVSYDQVQFTDSGRLSFSYLTLVGAYVVAGEKNATSTMMDTVVYDIASRKMLFRAPGTSQVQGRATPVDLSAELRHDSLQGFDEAAANMIAQLDTQLSQFKDRVKRDPQQVKVVYGEGYGGAAAGPWEMLTWLLVGIVLAMRSRIRCLRVSGSRSIGSRSIAT
ncbi:MAG: rhombotarget lipoprotein [Ketobacter sp.]|nr:MAG: rhombotarget lipoprotein [Ketobacter sp.]